MLVLLPNCDRIIGWARDGRGLQVTWETPVNMSKRIPVYQPSHAPIPVAVIGAGSMGRGSAQAFADDPAWELVAIADIDPFARERAKEKFPDVRVVEDGAELIADPNIAAVGLMTLADARPAQIRAALAAGKHVWAEKPIGETIEQEEALLEVIEASDRHVAVNLFNRNGAYHERMHAFMAAGEIGQVGCIRVRHQTPGGLPGFGHGPEGPPFHDCGMHYVDVARWYAGGEYADWHAQGLCYWGHPEPWWVSAHGTFDNGVVFSITQGFIFGQEAEKPRSSCGLEVIGTKGVMVMEHDFHTVRLDLRGTSQTKQEEFPYGGKKLDVMARRLATAIIGGPVTYPTARDTVVASRVSWDMLRQATSNAPVFGTPEDLERVKAYREELGTRARKRREEREKPEARE